MPIVIDDKTKEGIIADYVISNSINGVAKKYDVSWATAKKIIEEATNEINKCREEKQSQFASDAWAVVNAYTNKLMDSKTIKEAKASDCIKVITGILERLQKQQELNQQYDTMFYNIEAYCTKDFVDDMFETYRISDEFRKKYFESIEEDKINRSKKIKEKLKNHTMVLFENPKFIKEKSKLEIEKENRIKRYNRREELEKLIDEIIQEEIENGNL